MASGRIEMHKLASGLIKIFLNHVCFICVNSYTIVTLSLRSFMREKVKIILNYFHIQAPSHCFSGSLHYSSLLQFSFPLLIRWLRCLLTNDSSFFPLKSFFSLFESLHRRVNTHFSELKFYNFSIFVSKPETFRLS